MKPRDEVALPRPRRRNFRAAAFSAAPLVVLPAHDQGSGDPAQDVRFGDRRPFSFYRSQRLRRSRYASRCPDAGEHRDQDGRAVAGKQPGLTGRHPALLARNAPPFMQYREQDGRENDVPILLALALLDPDEHPVTIDIGELERYDLRGS